MKIEVFGKTWTLICKTKVKVTLLMKTWNDPTPMFFIHWKLMKIDAHPWKSMNIYENPYKNIKSMTIYGIYLFWKKKMGYILYSKNINASHICPPKRNKLFKQREWKSRFSGKHGLWSAKQRSKSLFWWKPEMIPLQCFSYIGN